MTRTAAQWASVLIRCGVLSRTADDWAPVFVRVWQRTVWSNPADERNFLGQVLHESARLERMEENLNYRAQRICEVWPERFPTLASALPYSNNPQALANKVYGGRIGNTEPGDGWLYRGRGLIQVTGRTNYLLAEQATGLPLVAYPDLLLDHECALRASIAWWERNVPDVDLGDVARVTFDVNKGRVGLEERKAFTKLATEALATM